MFGVLLIIGSYHLVLFAQRRDDLSASFRRFRLSIGARTFAMSIGQSLGLSTSVGAYQFMQSVEYASMPMMMATAMYFIEAVLPGPWFRKATHVWAMGLGIPLLLLAILTSKSTFGALLTVYQVHILGTLVVVLIYLVQGSLRGNRLARWCILAFLLVAFGAVNDILHSNDIIESTHIAPYTMIGFVLMQAGILSARMHRLRVNAMHSTRRNLKYSKRVKKPHESRVNFWQTCLTNSGRHSMRYVIFRVHS